MHMEIFSIIQKTCFSFCSHSEYRIQYANSKFVSLLIVKIVKMFYGLRLQVQKEMAYNRYAADLPREKWHSWDPMLLSGLYHVGFWILVVSFVVKISEMIKNLFFVSFFFLSFLL